MRWASPGHEIRVVWLSRAGHIPHPDLPYQSYGIWWTCGHPLVVVGSEKNTQKVILELRAICKWVAFGPIQEPWRLVNSSGDLSSRRFGLWWSKVLSRLFQNADFWLLFACKTGGVRHLKIAFSRPPATPQRSSPAPQALRSRLPDPVTVSIRCTPHLVV